MPIGKVYMLLTWLQSCWKHFQAYIWDGSDVNKKFDLSWDWKFQWDLRIAISGGNWLFRWDFLFSGVTCTPVRTTHPLQFMYKSIYIQEYKLSH